MSELYYGLPQSTWDDLHYEAEQIFYDSAIGQYIVGIYPAGNRIFGDESSPPGIMCLYIDSVNNLLDPFSGYHHKFSTRRLLSENAISPIVFVDFYKWIQKVRETCLPFYSWELRNDFLHMIPFGKHTIHEEESISSIVDMMAKISIKGNYSPEPWDHKYNSKEIHFNRTEAIIASERVFMPCANKEWDDQFDLESLYNLNNISDKEELNKHYIDIIKRKRPIKEIDNKIIQDIKKLTIDLYKFQM